MAHSDVAMRARPATIAPAPSKTPSTDHGDDSAHSSMPYTCQPCARRKVKCNRAIPVCSSCRKGQLECFYQAPPPRRRKRKLSDDVHERLAQYERMLQANGLLSKAEPTSPSYRERPQSLQEPNPLRVNQPETVRIGKLLSGDGKSRYIDSSLWRDLDNMREISEDEEDDQSAPVGVGSLTEDPLSSALLGVSPNIVEYHPSHKDAMKLWAVHVQNVEPLCKVLHIPTTARLVETVSQQPATASKVHECLLFAIYHLAVFSMTDEDCVREFGQSQTALLSKYRYAVRQALVNASWLKTTEMPVMQAYVLFLIAVRTQIDSHTFWILTGVAVRIAQRMGLHRDGESLGLPPFDVQMRRRLFWQLLPLDGFAGQVSGTGISIAPDSWDTKQPFNLNDAQIYPGMTQQPEEQKGATDMIFCLTRTELAKFYSRTGVKMKDAGATIQSRDSAEVEKQIDEVESIIETKYLRYCDIVNPLHFLTLGMARSAANTSRLRNRISRLMNQTIGDQERRELCVLAQKVVDTDSAAYGNPNLKKFHWQIRAFFLWDALICILTSLAKIGFFSPAELDAAWNKIADVYSNHQEILEAKGALHLAVGRVTLKAWTANPPSNSTSEPAFITTLRSQRRTKVAKRPEKIGDMTSNDRAAEAVSSLDSSPSSDAYALYGSLDGMDLNLGSNFNLDTADWMFWDQLIQDYQTMPTPQQQATFQ